MSINMCWKGQVYIAWNETEAILGLSPVPQLDLAYLKCKNDYNNLLCLTPDLPLGVASYLFSQMTSCAANKPAIYSSEDKMGKLPISLLTYSRQFLGKLTMGKASSLSTMGLLVKEMEKNAERLLKKEGYEASFHHFRAEDSYQLDLPDDEDLEPLVNLLAGRLLLGREIIQGIDEQLSIYYGSFDLKVLLQLLYLKGVVHVYPSIKYLGSDDFQCSRCGGVKKIVATTCFDCSEKKCVYCEECITMGEARLCRGLYGVEQTEEVSWENSWNNTDNLINGARGDYQLGFPLTQAQRDAKTNLEWFVQEDERDKCLVWAVCGAGKTEVSYGAIGRVLNRGGRVLFAIPRKDVVMELLPRLRSAFSNVKVTALYGGSKEKYENAPLVIATTHQTIRFYRKFDLIVLDEVDAFPYHGSNMLYNAVERSRKDSGKIIYMSATPRKELIKRADRKELGLVYIPARHHGFPVPEPEILTGPHCQLTKSGDVQFSDELLEFIHRTVEGDLAQLFIFTPTIFLTEKVGRALKKRTKLPPFNNFDGEWVEYSHSRDDARDEKRQGFSEGEFPIFVTTTIMERGITVPKANVLVLFSNYGHIFDYGTLVQMAGRSGRSEKYPQGKVLFVGESQSSAMEEAISAIKRQNQMAADRGYLKIDYPEKKTRRKLLWS